MTFRPTPVQRPRIPIWVAANLASETSVGRALRWDGIMPQTNDPEAIRALAQRIADEGVTAADGSPFAIVVEGSTKPRGTGRFERVRAVEDAGATWWVESDWTGGTVPKLRERIEAGPPRSG
jgi:hypothetical protein